MSIHIRTSPHPWAAGVREELGNNLEEFLEVIEPLDASHYVAKLSPTALLFQSARLDIGVPEKDATDFFRAASEPNGYCGTTPATTSSISRRLPIGLVFWPSSLACRPSMRFLKRRPDCTNIN